SGVPATATTGGAFTVSRTYNVGGGAAPSSFTLAYYSSTDAVFGNADDVLVGTETVSGAGLSAGAHAGTSPSLTINAAGNYCLFAKVDAAGAVTETDETNNVAQSAQQVTVTNPAPTVDLNWSGGGLSGVPATATTGAGFTVGRTYNVSGGAPT